MKKLRVPIPAKNAKELLDLSKKVLDKHLKDAEATKLKELDWPRLQPKIEEAILLHNEAERYRSLSQQMVQDRNILIENILENMRSSRDILTGIYIKNMKFLADWGYTVIEAPASKPSRKNE